MHSILPLTPRAKQPALHIHTKYTLSDVPATLYTLGCGVRPVLAAGGGERSGPNVLWWLLFSFMLGLRLGWGELSSPERVRNCYSRYGTLREPNMPYAHWRLLKPCAWNLLLIVYTFGLNKRTDIFGQFWQNVVSSPQICETNEIWPQQAAALPFFFFFFHFRIFSLQN